MAELKREHELIEVRLPEFSGICIVFNVKIIWKRSISENRYRLVNKSIQIVFKDLIDMLIMMQCEWRITN